MNAGQLPPSGRESRVEAGWITSTAMARGEVIVESWQGSGVDQQAVRPDSRLRIDAEVRSLVGPLRSRPRLPPALSRSPVPRDPASPR